MVSPLWPCRSAQWRRNDAAATMRSDVRRGLLAIPKELYEAATTDGAGAWDRFRHVTIRHQNNSEMMIKRSLDRRNELTTHLQRVSQHPKNT